MKNEKPILFSTPMIKAILDGSKTQTRRVVKHPAEDGKSGWHPTLTGFEFKPGGSKKPKCPYGKVGDEIWVREAWRVCGWSFDDGEMIVEFKDGEKIDTEMYCPDGNDDATWLVDYVHKMESKGIIKVPEDYDIDRDGEEFNYDFVNPFPWKPSIHMPRVASRIQLRISDVRIERLNDISEEDAHAEGVSNTENGWPDPHDIMEFETLWDSINGTPKKIKMKDGSFKDGPDYSWKENPWVWVVEFETV